MSEQAATVNKIDSDLYLARRTKGRWQALGIFFVLILPMLAAYIMFHWGVGISGQTVNKGRLINPPISLESLIFSNLKSKPINIMASGKKWRMIIPVSKDCTQACQQKLYTTRQVHIRLGNKANRVERWAVFSSSNNYSQMAPSLKQDHPRLKMAQLNDSVWPALLDESGYFLVDQDGFIMMQYRHDQSGNDLLKDVKKMLKVTYEK